MIYWRRLQDIIQLSVLVEENFERYTRVEDHAQDVVYSFGNATRHSYRHGPHNPKRARSFELSIIQPLYFLYDIFIW